MSDAIEVEGVVVTDKDEVGFIVGGVPIPASFSATELLQIAEKFVSIAAGTEPAAAAETANRLAEKHGGEERPWLN